MKHISRARSDSKVLSLFWRFSVGHRRWLLWGSLAAIVVVLARLAIPFPLRHVVKPSLKGATTDTPRLLSWMPVDWDPVIVAGVALLVLLLFLGLADCVQRICFARFAIGTVRSTREEAIREVLRLREATGVRPGDLVARLIGDAARAKAGLKGFLIHVGTNGLHLAGVLAVLVWVDPILSLLLAATFLFIALLTWYCTRSIYTFASSSRHKEGRLANRIHKAWIDDQSDERRDKLSRSRGQNEARMTRLQGLCTLGAHVGLGLGVLAVVVVGHGRVLDGRVNRENLLLFLLYAVFMRAPLVQLVRQMTRWGKIRACFERIATLCDSSVVPATPLPPLQRHLRLDGIKVSTSKIQGCRRRRLGTITLDIGPGERIAVVGPGGSGKTTLLRAIAGLEKLRRGRVTWDDLDLSERGMAERRRPVSFLPETPLWRRTPIRRLLQVASDATAAGESLEETSLRRQLKSWGAWRPIKRIAKVRESKSAVPQSKWEVAVASADLSLAETKALAIAQALRVPASIRLLDDPLSCMTEKERDAALTAILASAETVLVTFRSMTPLTQRFDRVIRLRGGRVDYDGPPIPDDSGNSETKSKTTDTHQPERGPTEKYAN